MDTWKMKRLFLDTEFNGFGGALISMAIVPEDTTLPEFYMELEMRDQLEPWVRDNVVPHLILVPVSYSKFQSELSEYLMKVGTCTIIVDWPDDIRYFCQALIAGPGLRINTPKIINFKMNLNIDYVSLVPHNALHDARGIREFYINKGL
jgi:hypothetical protein